ncbi:MAG: UbiD family decarboxylase [Pirellulales bacterium]
MGYRSTKACLDDLARHGHLVRIDQPIDPRLEAAEIHRRVFAAGGPALYFTNVKGSPFPMASNLFGTMERARFIFRDTLERVRKTIELKIDPAALARRPLRYLDAPLAALSMLPKKTRRGPVLDGQTTIDRLPQLKSWPDDGGAFITLPQVYSEDPAAPGWKQSNLGMYRVQLSGGRYQPNREIGMHYQIHRGIGVHHKRAMELGQPLPVNIFVGGSPAMTLAAVMPLPEGFPELHFAGALAGRRVRLIQGAAAIGIAADADFCITGTIDPDKQLPEGPFGDHLGYYSLAHNYPVLRVDKVYHRSDAVWPFTVVGRPPQEDTIFGELIHDLTGPVIPTVITGVKEVNAVDAAGVHPLLLAIGSERYQPFLKAGRPQELLTQANAILGQGQLSLAKYLWIAAAQENEPLSTHNIAEFLQYMLRRVDWRRDLHFQTSTTIDTLDYTGSGLNQGSKLVIAAHGPPLRELPKELPAELALPDGFSEPAVVMPGVLAIRGPAFPNDPHREATAGGADPRMEKFCQAMAKQAEEQGQAAGGIGGFPLVVVANDSRFVAESLNNFLWATFTRSNPAADVYGTAAAIRQKHWGCEGSLVIDARTKPHHAPPLVEDAEVTRRVDALAASGGPLHGII